MALDDGANPTAKPKVLKKTTPKAEKLPVNGNAKAAKAKQTRKAAEPAESVPERSNVTLVVNGSQDDGEKKLAKPELTNGHVNGAPEVLPPKPAINGDAASANGIAAVPAAGTGPAAGVETSEQSETVEQQPDSAGEPGTGGVAVANGNEIAEKEELEHAADAGITIAIHSPGIEPLSVQLTSIELVQEIHQVLMDREETCHRTCFSLQLNGTTLDNFAEIKTIPDLTTGSVVKVVEEPYTMREARIHVRHVRDLLKNLDPADAYNGIECTSLTFFNAITQGELLEHNNKKKSRADSIDCTPPDYVTPGVKECPLLPLHPNTKNAKGPQALRVLTTSAWNPPPGPRKLHGDLMYLYVVTMEDKRFHISACTRGFFINQSTDEVFNPRADNPSHLSHSLIDLLSTISPAFRRAFLQIQKKRTSRHAFERVATPYQVYQWSAPQLEHTVDAIRAEDAFSSKLGYEEHIPGQTRDWNEELQSTRELPRTTIEERILRERAIFKVHGDFVTAATRGAMAVIDGNVLAINPGEDPKMQMFIWNNIFFSLGFDVRDHYKELGGDHAAFVAPRCDLHGVRVYNGIDLDGLYTLGTVVVDYRGFRITAQSIIPGILEREQEQSVVYGSIDFGKTVLSHPKYLELLRKAAVTLKILPHSVLNEDGKEVELCSSVECKGIIGNDNRHYILDLLRTFPPDVNFLKLSDVELCPQLKKDGFPIEHKHKLCCLRQELLEAFSQDKYIAFLHTAANMVNANKQKALENNEVTASAEAPPDQHEATSRQTTADEPLTLDTAANKLLSAVAEKQKSDGKDDKLSTVARDQPESSLEVVRQAFQTVGSCSDREFELRFNPDVFSTGIRHVEDATGINTIAKQKKLVQEAAEFLVLKQIPTFVKEHLNHSTPPMDGAGLTESLHSHGINMRYLGKVINKLAKEPRLEYLHRIAITEIIVRASRHIYYSYMQNTDPLNLAAAISHFLNCLLTFGAVNRPPVNVEPLRSNNKRSGKNKSKHSKNAKGAQLGGNVNNDWVLVTPKSLWLSIKKEVKSYWDFELECDSIETAVTKYGFQRISLLRAICLKVGIQILLREYNFESRNKPTFGEDDIVNVFPIVKHISPRATDAYKVYSHGQSKIHNGLIREGYEFISEALNLLNSVFGAMHTENGSCLRLLARLSYLLNEVHDAMSIQQRAVIMSERVNGIDHPCTVLEYTHMSLYSFAIGHISVSLKLLYRARYLAVLICGEDHPEIGLIDSNIGLILQAVGQFDLSLRFIESALRLNLKYHGRTLQTALSFHLMAKTLAALGDYRTALQNEKDTYSIYKTLLGEEHDRTVNSSEYLKVLTNQAVCLHKKLYEMNGKPATNLTDVPQETQTMTNVLELLNHINGIMFVQFSQNELALVRTELEKHINGEVSSQGNMATLKQWLTKRLDKSKELAETNANANRSVDNSEDVAPTTKDVLETATSPLTNE